jgi:phosphatidylserine/phosphatidylglycerophosphate/cardiolipin synthase-like enzyme
MVNENFTIPSTYYPQFGETLKSDSSNNHCNVVNLIINISNKIHNVAMRIWHALFPKYRTNFNPGSNNINAPALGTFVNTDVYVSNNAEESYKWKCELVSSAEQSIELSANFAGGEVFRDFLRLVENRMKEKIELRVHLLISNDLLENEDKALLKTLNNNYSNRFNFLITDRIYGTSGSRENHVKLLVVDEKYFVTGGTGIHRKMIQESVQPNAGNVPDNFKSKFLPKGFRDTDVVGRGDIAKTMRNQFFNLFRIWEHKMVGNAVSRHFNLEQNNAICQAFETCEGVTKQVQLKFIVSGPEHRDNPIVEEYSRLISKAEKKVRIANLIFNPPKKIKGSIKKLNKVKIKGYFNGSTSISNYLYIFPNRLNYNLLTHAYEYRKPDQLYHKKIMVVDQTITIIGTANLGIKSSQNDHEAIVVIENNQVAEKVISALKDDSKNSIKYSDVQLKKVRSKNWLMSRFTILTVGTYFG